MNKFTEIKWPAEFMDLKRVEELFLCNICYQYMQTTVMTPCSHNYCSLCIRKYLHFKTQCPTCFALTYEKDLRINRTLDEILQIYLKVREKIAVCVTNREVVSTDKSSEEESCSTPKKQARNNQTIKTVNKPVQAQRCHTNDTVTENKPVAAQEKTPTREISSPSTSQGNKSIKSFFNSPSNKVIHNNTNVNTVPCPVCNVEVSEQTINVHLDACLKRESGLIDKPKQKPKLKPIGKLVLRFMKDTELKKKLKELGLSTTGNRKTMESRYHRYVLIYNAECDKPEPRSISELIKQCNDEELQEKKMQAMAELGIKLHVTRNDSEAAITEEHRKYREKNKTSFENLIQEIKQRQNNKPEVTNSNLSPVADEKKKDNKILNSSSNESEESFIYSAENDMFHDSDSDMCCPLQRYTSEDPARFLCVQLSESDNSSSSVKETKMEITTSSSVNDDIFNMSTDSDTTDIGESVQTPHLRRQPVNKRLKLSHQSTNSEFELLSPVLDSVQVNSSKKHETRINDLNKSLIEDSSYNVICDESIAAAFCDDDSTEFGTTLL